MRFPTFNAALLIVGLTMFLCLGVIVLFAFNPTQADSSGGKEAIALCDFGFKGCLGGVLGLIGGRSARLR